MPADAFVAEHARDAETTPTEAVMPGGVPLPAADLLRMAIRAVAVEFGTQNWLASVAQHLITCAAEVVAAAPRGDLQAARDALATARAAVGTATYAVRRLHDDVRTDMPCPSTSS